MERRFVKRAIPAKKSCFKPDHNYITKAIEEFKKNGGKIKKIATPFYADYPVCLGTIGLNVTYYSRPTNIYLKGGYDG